MINNGSLSNTLDRMMTINRALDEALAGSWNGAFNRGRVWVPAVDVVERTDAYLIAMEVPGVDPSSIDISFEQNVLTIRGTKPLAIDLPKDDEVRVYSAERVTGAFERSIRLPEYVDSESISAETRNGLLFLTVPKAQSARARKIQIRGVEQKQVAG
jgi:HSP20 family protein